MTTVNTDDFLAHYGVKGMRWGKRKQSAPTRSSSPRQNEAKAKVAKSMGKKVAIIGGTAAVAAGALFLASQRKSSFDLDFAAVMNDPVARAFKEELDGMMKNASSYNFNDPASVSKFLDDNS